VHEAAHTSLRRGLERVASALDVAALEVLARAPVAKRCRGMKRKLATLRSGAHRRDIAKIAGNRLAATHTNPRGCVIRARKRSHRVPIAS
jgi:hypothetical protein